MMQLDKIEMRRFQKGDAMKNIKIQYNAPTVLTFAALSLAALLLGWITGGASTYALFSVYRAPLTSPLTYVRLVGHVLGHSGLEHFFSNMLLLLVVGPPMEEKYGSGNLALAIVVTAVISGLVQMIFFPGTALLGASGIVFMMIVLSSFAGVRSDGIPLTLVLVLILYLGREVVDAVTVRDSVSQLTHIIGGLCGAMIGLALEHVRGQSDGG